MNFVITAGPTREFIDPFRFISNPSSGKMGYALARAALRRGHAVVLVSGPVSRPIPAGAETIRVTSAREMLAAVIRHFKTADAVVMAAAVSDYRPAKRLGHKLRKTDEHYSLNLVRNPDILKSLAKRKGNRIIVGFSAETENIIDNARKKLEIKNLDFIVANDIAAPGSGFAHDTIGVTLIDARGRAEQWPLLPKREVAERIVERVEMIASGRKRA